MSGFMRRSRIVLAFAWLLLGSLALTWWLAQRPGIEITWRTETEFDSAGFNLLRSGVESGPFVQVNDQLIAASNDAAAGAEYSFVDQDVTAGQSYFYQLQDVDLAGNVTAQATISHQAPGRPTWLLAVGAASLMVGAVLAAAAWAMNRQR
jgi:hypothetical protein